MIDPDESGRVARITLDGATAGQWLNAESGSPLSWPAAYIEAQAKPTNMLMKMRGNTMSETLRVRPNGAELTGADPHAKKYSSRDVVSCGFASGGARS